MDAWVYLFSKFSHEALLFEALALALGLFGYAIFYLIRKRKYGVAGKDIPSNVVRGYLAQLVADAEEMRIQLFGLLGQGEATARMMSGLQEEDFSAAAIMATPSLPTSAGVDPNLAAEMQELERRLSAQAAALDAVVNDKMKLEEELAKARANTLAAESAKGKDTGSDRSGPMSERLKQLEAQLAEYAIIEDDLANLKRLQKENKNLKEQLANASNEIPAAAVAAKTPIPVPEKKVGPPTPEVATEVAAEVVATQKPDSATDAFDALMEGMEKDLADVANSATVVPSTPTPPNEVNLVASPVPEQSTDAKSEEELQADFEKMLNS